MAEKDIGITDWEWWNSPNESLGPNTQQALLALSKYIAPQTNPEYIAQAFQSFDTQKAFENEMLKNNLFQKEFLKAWAEMNRQRSMNNRKVTSQMYVPGMEMSGAEKKESPLAKDMNIWGSIDWDSLGKGLSGGR